MTDKQYWLVKSEPSAYSYDQLEQDGSTRWDGVRNHQAKANLGKMRVGDAVLFYHSIVDKAVIGLCEVSREGYPEPGAEAWTVVDVVPVRRLKRPVTLAEIKVDASLSDIALLKQSRLSVMPLTQMEFERILALSDA
jgi:predicted RNA-binding protein with PUA-like domain